MKVENTCACFSTFTLVIQVNVNHWFSLDVLIFMIFKIIYDVIDQPAGVMAGLQLVAKWDLEDASAGQSSVEKTVTAVLTVTMATLSAFVSFVLLKPLKCQKRILWVDE